MDGSVLEENWSFEMLGLTFSSKLSCCGVMVITTAQLHSTEPELSFYTGSNPASSMLEIHDGEDLWQWSWLEIRLNAFRWSTIPQKQFNLHWIATLTLSLLLKLPPRKLDPWFVLCTDQNNIFSNTRHKRSNTIEYLLEILKTHQTLFMYVCFQVYIIYQALKRSG